jgi:hypothetical protein
MTRKPTEFSNNPRLGTSTSSPDQGEPGLPARTASPSSSPTSWQQSDSAMVRIGIRVQLAALVLISSLIGIAVVTIATWVSPSLHI